MITTRVTIYDCYLRGVRITFRSLDLPPSDWNLTQPLLNASQDNRQSFGLCYLDHRKSITLPSRFSRPQCQYPSTWQCVYLRPMGRGGKHVEGLREMMLQGQILKDNRSPICGVPRFEPAVKPKGFAYSNHLQRFADSNPSNGRNAIVLLCPRHADGRSASLPLLSKGLCAATSLIRHASK